MVKFTHFKLSEFVNLRNRKTEITFFLGKSNKNQQINKFE